MKKNKASKLKVFLLVHMLSLVLLVVFFEIAYASEIKLPWIIATIVSLVILLISFIMTIWKTGLWQRAHLSDKALDEREIQQNYKILKLSYSVFTIVILLVIYLYFFLDLRITALPAAWAIYLAHVIPAFFLGWKYGIQAED